MENDKITVSIITCIYNGENYIERLCKMFEENYNQLKGKCLIEYIFINDSPWISIDIPDQYVNLPIYVFNNTKNEGIHISRVNGIKHSKGKYILILDQDDEISNNYIIYQLRKIADYDVVVCNGYKESATDSKPIYRDLFKMSLVNRKNAYLLAANQIVSPGQCLIKKESIPKAWIKYKMKTNGSDDLYLWLLFLNSGTKFVLNYKRLYCHKQVGDNLSNNLKKMCESDHEMCNLATKFHLLPLNDINKRLRMLRFIADTNYTQKITLGVLLRYPDIVFFKVLAKLI